MDLVAFCTSAPVIEQCEEQNGSVRQTQPFSSVFTMAAPTINKSCFCPISVTGFSRYARTLRILAEDAYVLSSVPPGMPLNIEITVSLTSAFHFVWSEGTSSLPHLGPQLTLLSSYVI